VTPDDLKYTKEHEWVALTGEDTVRIGITDYAQEQLGDVVFVQLPTVGDTVAAGDSLGEVESTKSVSDIYAPVAGVIIAGNDALEAQPELVNTDPYGDGWMAELRVSDASELDALMDASGYRRMLDEQ
jgi:glycine cleavage system H protein